MDVGGPVGKRVVLRSGGVFEEIGPVGVTVKLPRFAQSLLLLSRATHPAVLINTNGHWHGWLVA